MACLPKHRRAMAANHYRKLGSTANQSVLSPNMESPMKSVIILSSIVAVARALSEPPEAEGQTYPDFSVINVDINNLGIASSHDEYCTGAGFPWIWMRRGMAQKESAQSLRNYLIAGRPLSKMVSLKVCFWRQQSDGLSRYAVRPLRRANGTTGGCTLGVSSDGKYVSISILVLVSVTERKSRRPLEKEKDFLLGWLSRRKKRF